MNKEFAREREEGYRTIPHIPPEEGISGPPSKVGVVT